MYYVDELDINLNPRIGACWSRKGRQPTVQTQGQNEKRYLADALHARTGKVVWVKWPKRNSEIFVRLMAELRKRYRRARKITLILDNYVIHKRAMTKCFLSRHPEFGLLFQPVYYPWVNRIERLWKKLHDTVRRNYCYSTMAQLMSAVRRFMEAVSPFSGSNPGFASRIQLASATGGLMPKNTWFGVFIPRHFLGRLLSLSMTMFTSVSVMVEKSRFFGKYCLTNPLLFSFRPRSQEA